ncbi:hypothetical protein FIU97_01825 [Roseivivax sp. THAF40]|nr:MULTISPECIES: hypothetical protein [unclassified Roseivivax]QFS81573.1 hypothetical protein FIV09_01915 [Roseivivax sp. THAF197b]QFT45302.1 hypothetical protein FIU97_01825 [Roseivivax sp. THAF40]
MIDPLLTYVEQRLSRDLDAALTLRSLGFARPLPHMRRYVPRVRLRAAR